MKKNYFKLLLTTFLLLGANHAFAQDYFVDATLGSDANNGLTEATAWQTFSNINSTTFQPGDSIFLKRNETFNGKIQLTDDFGLNGNPITFGAYGVGANPVIDSPTQNRIFDLRNGVSYINFENIQMQNSTESGIFLYTNTGDTFTGLEFNNLDISAPTAFLFQTNGSPTSGSRFINLTITNSTIGFNHQGYSIADVFEDITMTSVDQGFLYTNNINNSTLDMTNVSVDGATGVGIYLRRLENSNFANVSVTNGLSSGIFFQNYIDNVTILDSDISSNLAYGIRADSVDFIQDFVIENTNISSNLDDGIYLRSTVSPITVTLEGNTINSNGENGVNVSGLATSRVDVRNTVFNSNITGNGIMILGNIRAYIDGSEASSNGNDGFNIRDNAHVEISRSIADTNGVDGIGSDGDGYSWHDDSTGFLAFSSAKNNLKSAVANVNNTSTEIYGNIFSHDTFGTIPLFSLTENAVSNIYNNTLINPSQEGQAVSLSDNSSGIFANNLIHGFDVGIQISTLGVFQELNSIVFNTATEAFKDFVESSTSSSTIDPLLIDILGENYRPTVNSPLARIGSASYCPLEDYDGNLFNSPCDIGAFYTMIEEISKKSGSRISYVCKDPNASNYSRFGRHQQSLCLFDSKPLVTLENVSIIDNMSTPENPFNGQECPSDLILTDNMKKGDVNGLHSSYNKSIITQVSLLQEHINRLLQDDYGYQAAGPIDKWFGAQTSLGVKRLQTKLNVLLEGIITPLEVDGIVGQYTRNAINMSC